MGIFQKQSANEFMFLVIGPYSIPVITLTLIKTDKLGMLKIGFLSNQRIIGPEVF